ncbi:Metallo-dependent phosphatase-like protein [Crepidotus variabilis]|uniref:Double-strand break repair protein n=1 Tax=Crepidotus variabilis TaxID=179855 RepID=A0A9P6JKE7_9AGAR|nr:Metallo-dependent phosphatase-like protein [Crepidotus variabilis]
MFDDEDQPPPSPTMNGIQAGFPDDTIRILLATDNHIGYMERDPIRGQDSINTFKEILQLAVKQDVDFVLLAGDLFHENKPSRDCLYKVTALLREYTLGDKPVQIELLSDPLEGKADGFSFPAVNYEDPNFNVAIPVFSIHGNHDDPQGAGAEGALCALDILSVSGLINYMGKIDLPVSVSEAEAQNTGIAVRPVLLRKGNTSLGMYGIGNVKDQRMHFELRSNRVRMFMPKDKGNWFNILLLHQNRVKHGPQEFVPEGMFDDSVDLVVWGHEHDCRITPEPVAGKKYYITQPGSSVATSLADGEAIEKHVAVVEIQGKDFKLTPIPLRTVRPFVIEEVVLEDIADESGLDLNDQMAITKFLKSKVNELIEKANEQWEERNTRAVEDGEPEIPPMLPLIRLKVDTTGVTETSNPVRFGQEFTGRIANPRDVLIFHRAKKAGGARSGNSKVKIDQPELSIDDPDLSISEKLAKVRVGTLVKEYLAAQELQVIGEGGMSDAIRVFVEKDDIHAIQTHVGKSLKDLMKNVQPSEDAELPEDELEDMLYKAKEQQDQEYLENAKNLKASKSKGKAKADEADESDDSMKMDIDTGGIGGDSDFEELTDEDPPPKKGRGAASKTKAAASKATTTKAKVAPKAAPKKKAPAKGKGKKKAVDTDEDEDEIIEIDDDDDEEEEEAPKTAKKTNRAAVLSQPAAKKAPSKKAPKATASKPSQNQLNFAPARASRAAATKARGRIVIDDDDDDED